MKFVRLEVGSFDGEAKVSEDNKYLDKAVMLVYTGQFKSLDGDVEIKDEDIDKLAENHNSFLSKLGRLASGEVPLRHNPPLQLDHSTSARDTVGRLMGPLKVGEHTLEDGTKVKALFGNTRVLGAENMERVLDGRWSNVSIGADLENHKISELSITPFPAAADASLLSRMATKVFPGKYNGCEFTIYRDSGMFFYKIRGEKVNKYTYGTEEEAIRGARNYIDQNVTLSNDPKDKNLSQGDDEMPGYKDLKEKMGLYEKCRKHLTTNKQMSEEDADKKLEAATDDELTAMSTEHDDVEKKLAEDKKKDEEANLKRMAGLKDQKTKLIELSKGMTGLGVKMASTEKLTKIQTRMSKLLADRKITPAEVKATKVTELASKSDEVIEATLASYEKRQPVIDVGLRGSSKGLSPAQVKSTVKKLGSETLELKTRLAMPSKRDAALVRLKELGLNEADLEKEVQVHIDNVPNGEHDISGDEAFEAAYTQAKKLSTEGKEDEAKEHLRAYCKTLGGGPDASSAPAAHAEMSALATEFQTMQTKFNEFVKLAAPAFGATDEDLK